MSKIEKGLHAHHANLQAQNTATSSTTAPSAARQQDSSPDASGPAFAKINSVATGSPADAAGMKAGDKVVTFGSANWMNHEKLAKVAEVVSQNEGVRAS